MCKGISVVVTQGDCYHSRDNSHETIKKEHGLRDDGLVELLIVELYPRGERLLSRDLVDWELVIENHPAPQWYIDNKDEVNDRIFNFLFGPLFARFIASGIDTLNLSGLGYKQLPDWCGVGIKVLNCSHNQLTSLSVPSGIDELDCSHNQLTSLTVPTGINVLDCRHNQLTSLTVPRGINVLDCSHNQLTSLSVPSGIAELDCYHNQLTSLTVPRGIKALYCSHNQLTSLTVPKDIEYLYYDNHVKIIEC